MFVNQNIVKCDKTDCFAAAESIKHKGEYHCKCLRNNDFGGEPCPFYKTHEEHAASNYAAEQRRIALAKAAKEKEQHTDIRTISGVMFRRKETANG